MDNGDSRSFFTYGDHSFSCCSRRRSTTWPTPTLGCSSAPESQGCKGAPAADVIHGIDDPHVPFAAGEMARDNYLKRAGCTSTTTPLLADMHAEIRKDRDAKPSIEAAKCVDYQGCAAGSPVRWCEHSYGGYDGSTHGWPPVGGQMIWDFVKAL